MSLLITIAIMTLFCNGWYMITRDGMILDPARKLFLTIIGGWDRADGGIEWDDVSNKFILLLRFLYKPLFGCIICMSSIPGSIAFWSASKLTETNLIYWPIACVCCAFANYFVYVLLKKIED